MQHLNNKSGYSLLEVTVVIVLIAVLCYLSINVGTYLQRLLIRTDIDKLYITLKYLQQSAQVTHKKQVLILDPLHRQYSYQNTIERLSPSAAFSTTPGIKGPPSDPKNIITSPITFQNNQIVFHPDGTIDSGTVYLLDTADQRLYAVTCGVGGSSYIRVYRYEKTWHLLNIQ